MEWSTLEKLSESRFLVGSGLVLVTIPILANLLEELAEGNSAQAILYILEPNDLALPAGLSRLYVASALVFVSQLIVRGNRIFLRKVPAELEAWKLSTEGIAAREKIRKTNQRGLPGLDEALLAEYQRRAERSEKRLRVIRWITTFLIGISLYMMVVTFLNNIVAVFVATDPMKLFVPFLR